MYTITAPLIAPFVGLFGTPQLGRSVFEPHSIVALCIYALLAWLLGSVIWLLLGDTRADVATTRRTLQHTEQVNDRDLAA
jgi:biopolymer transport protein ExbB/TolQ